MSDLQAKSTILSENKHKFANSEQILFDSAADDVPTFENYFKKLLQENPELNIFNSADGREALKKHYYALYFPDSPKADSRYLQTMQQPTYEPPKTISADDLERAINYKRQQLSITSQSANRAVIKPIQVVDEVRFDVPPLKDRQWNPYNGRKFTREQLAQRYQVEPESVASVHALANLHNIEDSAENKQRRAEILIKYAHEADQQRLTDWLHQQTFADGKPQNSAVMRKSEHHIKIHARLDMAAHRAKASIEMRLYWIIKQLDVDTSNGRGWVEAEALRDRLQELELYTRSSFSRWLKKGAKYGFWQLVRNGHEITRIRYLKQEKMVAKVFDLLSDDDLQAFIGPDAPGGNKPIWVDCRGSIQAWRGNVFGAWIELRDYHETGFEVSNAKAGELHGCHEGTIRNRRNRTDITSEQNIAIAPPDSDAAIPAHAVKRGDNYHWRMVNTYHAPDDTRKHNHVGRQRKMRDAANRYLSEHFTPDVVYGGTSLFERVGQVKRYFDRHAVKQLAKRLQRQPDDNSYLHDEKVIYSKKSQHHRYDATRWKMPKSA